MCVPLELCLYIDLYGPRLVPEEPQETGLRRAEELQEASEQGWETFISISWLKVSPWIGLIYGLPIRHFRKSWFFHEREFFVEEWLARDGAQEASSRQWSEEASKETSFEEDRMGDNLELATCSLAQASGWASWGSIRLVHERC